MKKRDIILAILILIGLYLTASNYQEEQESAGPAVEQQTDAASQSE
ncbi:MAG: hypothetical protein R3E62_01730 [Pseudomonadales bacterium]|jgi:hypothetical protein